MCKDFGFLVSDNIWELKNLKEKVKDIKNPDVLIRGLLCDSKQRIIDTYLSACSNLMVFIGSQTQLLGITDDIDILDFRITNTKQIFRNSVNSEILKEIQSNEYCLGCTRTADLFSMMQGQLEDVLFEDIRSAMLPFLGSSGQSTYDVCEEILDDIYEFANTALLHLSGLRINCMNIKDSIFTDTKSKFSINDIVRLKPEFKNEPYVPPSSCIFGPTTDRVESLHIFLNERFFKVKKWFDVYINLYSTYHKYPQRINVILDYQLLDDIEFTEEDFLRYKRMEQLFGSVCMLNCEHLNFGKYTDKLSVSCPLKLEECEG